MMLILPILIADMGLKLYPEHAKISKHFYYIPDEFADA
jgi:catalase (peroxidase I)